LDQIAVVGASRSINRDLEIDMEVRSTKTGLGARFEELDMERKEGASDSGSCDCQIDLKRFSPSELTY
jgi:hypothetical protein